MNARNPYDRRRGPRDRGAMLSGTDSFGWSSQPARTPLSIHDLEAMAHSAFRRGLHEDGERHFEEVRQSRREAWGEGYGVGLADGRESAVSDFARLHRDRVEYLQGEALKMARAFEADPRRVTKDELAAMVDATQALLLGIQNSLLQDFRVFE